MKVKTSELSGAQLDWAVAKAEGHDAVVDEEGEVATFKTVLGNEYKFLWKASTNWAQGGPIIERERIALWWDKWDEVDSALPIWAAVRFDGQDFHGPTPLIAAMRCYVASKLGEEVEVPEMEEVK